ncbi:hypothetical protein OIU74_020134 [Salix koriyanagi]|uniref:Uncharacterized protein n=1 Tax=Salix koriyanagi TaxID=2511006 RepID=A0A9Q0P5W0_9ROSI|nr:hypothetical protein OIU74_020134 [Salix koriyanagi]
MDQATPMQQEQQTLTTPDKTALSVASPNIQTQTSSHPVTSPTKQQNNNLVTHSQTKSLLVTSQLNSAQPTQLPVTSSDPVTQKVTQKATTVPSQHAPSTQLTICSPNSNATLNPSPLQAMQAPPPDMLLICQTEDHNNEVSRDSVQATGRVEDMHLPLCLESKMAQLPPASPIPPSPNILNTTIHIQSPTCNQATASNKSNSSSSPQVKKKRGSRKGKGGI